MSGLGARNNRASGREQAGGERAADERSEHLMADATDPGLRDLHRQAADLHRQALHQYEETARSQQRTPTMCATPPSGRSRW